MVLEECPFDCAAAGAGGSVRIILRGKSFVSWWHSDCFSLTRLTQMADVSTLVARLAQCTALRLS